MQFLLLTHVLQSRHYLLFALEQQFNELERISLKALVHDILKC